MKKPLVIAMCAAVVLWALSGCMRTIYDVTLNSDGTASGSMIVAIEEVVLTEAGMTVEDAFGPDSDLTAGLDNATVSDYSADGYVGKLVTFENQTIEEFGVSSGEGFTRDGDDFVFQGSIIDEETLTSFNDPTMTGGYGEPDLRLSITFPGAVSEHNGVLSGKTVTWDAALLLSGEEPYARGSALGTAVEPTDEPTDDEATPVDDEATPVDEVTPTEEADEDEDTTPHKKSGGDSNPDLWKWLLIGGLGASGVGLMVYGIGKSKTTTKS